MHRARIGRAARTAALAVLALGMALPGTAWAHQGNPNYRSVIRAVTPRVSGVHLEVLNFDDRLALTNSSGRTVVVQGYNGEPYARILGDGTVQVNRRSPALYLNVDRQGQAPVPAYANFRAAPVWRQIDRSGRYEWHDHRIHWMGQGLPPQITDKGKRTKVDDWQIPIAVGPRKGSIAGSLFWQPEKSSVPVGAIVAMIVVLLLAVAVVVIVRRRRRAEPSAIPAGKEAW